MFYIFSMDHNNILGVVLAGGKSQRFGEDKSQVKLNDKRLIDYILTEIITEFNEILIIANNSIDFMPSPKIIKVEDDEKDLGPLGGILTAMKWINKNKKNYKWISTFPSDTPFFNKTILNNFYKKININKGQLFFIKSNQTRHNIFGLLSIELLKQIEEDLMIKGERKVELWANKVGVQTIDMQFKNKDPFFNINTKEDLEQAKLIMQTYD